MTSRAYSAGAVKAGSATARWRVALAVISAVFVSAGRAAPPAHFAHRIRLLDKKGNLITPASTAPYSTRRTCGHCHDYDTIAMGTHEHMRPDEALPEPETFPGRLWMLTHKASGMQAHPSMGFMAPKKNPDGVGLSTWGFARQFGSWHVGGGMLEVDRSGKRYVEAVGAAKKLPAELAADGDYKGAKWQLTGDLEVDCLMCHGGPGYEPVERALQLKDENFKWAATVAAGFGTVKGAAKNIGGGEEDEEESAPPPKVAYNKRIFNDDGSVDVDLRLPSSDRCLFCHESRHVKPIRPIQQTTDVHRAAGIPCIDCHPTGIEHKPSPGFERAEEKGLTCRGCHTVGRHGAPVATHPGLPDLHLLKIACVTCHSGPRPHAVTEPVETVTTALWPHMTQQTREQYRGPVWQMPVYKRDAVGQLRLYQRLLPKYWAVVNDDGTLRGLLPEELNAAFKQPDATKDTDTQIKETLEAMSAALNGRKVAYLEGGMKYELADGKVASTPSDAAAPMDYPVAHDVRPTAQALGAGGCTDCHSLAAPFLGMVVPTDPDRSQTQQMHEQWGISSLAVGAGALREEFIKPYGPWLIPLTLLACLLHYVIFGAKIVKHDDPEDTLSRFTTTERLLHFFQMATFVVLAATGLGFLASSAGWWSVPRGGLARSIHVTCGLVSIVSSLGFVLQQLRQGILRKYDMEWFLTLGGYLWIKAEPPAGKFNAGQKLFYWLAAACAMGLGLTGLSMAYNLAPAGWDVYAWTLHDLAAAVLIPSVLGHLYLGTIANPGTIQAIFTGTVTRAWAKKHHSIWYEEVK